jgi:hypothetical protein
MMCVREGGTLRRTATAFWRLVRAAASVASVNCPPRPTVPLTWTLARTVRRRERPRAPGARGAGGAEGVGGASQGVPTGHAPSVMFVTIIIPAAGCQGRTMSTFSAQLKHL